MVDRPAAELVDPQSYDPVPDLVENIVGASQYISVSYWIGWAVEQICGTNPWMWVAEQFAGDYEAAQRAGIALKNLGEFNAAYSAAVKNNTEAVIPAAWQGNAAESAHEYFSSLSKALTDQVAELQSIGREFETMAVGVYEAAAGFKGFFEMALDWAIIAAVEAAAAAATSWTIVGGIAGGVATAASIYKGVTAWQQALHYHTIAWNAVQSFTGVVAGYLAALDGMEKVPLPGTGYDHPGVA